MEKPLKQIIGSTVLVGAAVVAAHFIAPMEGTEHKAYRDGGGVWTICKGHTKDVYEGMTADDNQCDVWFGQDIAAAQILYDAYVLRKQPRNVEAAAISFIFNTGGRKFARSTLLVKLNSTASRSSICGEYLRWKYQGPVDCSLVNNVHICGGLWNRRQQERALCMDDTWYGSYDVASNGAITGVKGKQP